MAVQRATILGLSLLLPSLSVLPDKEPCLEECGNFTGWCSWCGVGKACCRAGQGPEECLTSADSFYEGNRCIQPSDQALKTLGVVSFSFDLHGLFYDAVEANLKFKESLVLRAKDFARKLMLNTSQPHQMAIDFSRGGRGFATVHMTMMIPSGGKAAVVFAENRLCSMPSVAKFEADAQNVDGMKFGEHGKTVEVRFRHRKVEDGKACPKDPAASMTKRASLESQAQVWLPWLAAGLFGGSCLTCALLSLCNDHCKEKPVRGSARRHPHEGKAQVSWKDSFRDEGLLPLRTGLAQESNAFSSQGAAAQLSQFSSGTYQPSAVASWQSAGYT